VAFVDPNVHSGTQNLQLALVSDMSKPDQPEAEAKSQSIHIVELDRS
jgi:hypothetical protein